MQAVEWHGTKDVRVKEVAKPAITDPQVRAPPKARRLDCLLLSAAHSLGLLCWGCSGVMGCLRESRDKHARTQPPAWGASQTAAAHCPLPPAAASQDVILRITSTCICGSDLHLYTGKCLPGSRRARWLWRHPRGPAMPAQMRCPRSRAPAAAAAWPGPHSTALSLVFSSRRDAGHEERRPAGARGHVSLLMPPLPYPPACMRAVGPPCCAGAQPRCLPALLRLPAGASWSRWALACRRCPPATASW